MEIQRLHVWAGESSPQSNDYATSPSSSCSLPNGRPGPEGRLAISVFPLLRPPTSFPPSFSAPAPRLFLVERRAPDVSDAGPRSSPCGSPRWTSARFRAAVRFYLYTKAGQHRVSEAETRHRGKSPLLQKTTASAARPVPHRETGTPPCTQPFPAARQLSFCLIPTSGQGGFPASLVAAPCDLRISQARRLGLGLGLGLGLAPMEVSLGAGPDVTAGKTSPVCGPDREGQCPPMSCRCAGGHSIQGLAPPR